jgi:hypothetical protein
MGALSIDDSPETERLQRAKRAYLHLILNLNPAAGGVLVIIEGAALFDEGQGGWICGEARV